MLVVFVVIVVVMMIIKHYFDENYLLLYINRVGRMCQHRSLISRVLLSGASTPCLLAVSINCAILYQLPRFAIFFCYCKLSLHNIQSPTRAPKKKLVKNYARIGLGESKLGSQCWRLAAAHLSRLSPNVGKAGTDWWQQRSLNIVFDFKLLCVWCLCAVDRASPHVV